MTTQEAKEVLNNIWDFVDEQDEGKGDIVDNAMNEAIEALEKQDAMQRVVDRLEEQAEECKKYWDKFDDEDAFGGMNAYMNSLSIIKEEVG